MASELPKKEEQHSSSELFSSAKLVADAAQSAMKNETDKVDKAKVADAAGDLLDAAGQYGKLDDQKGIGQYVDKAADYLHQYQSSGNTAAAAPPSSNPPKEESKGEGAPSGGGGGGGGGFGDFAKMAGGFLNK